VALGELSSSGVVGVGIDVVEVDRFRTVLGRRPGIAARLFSDDERAYATRRRDPSEPLAARFAAKEAVLKAMGAGLWQVPLRGIEVLRGEGGDPTVRLTGRAAELATRLGITSWRLSLAHTSRSAHAVALALREA
jgi:holo-[acyl-carrier protein] synthase